MVHSGQNVWLEGEGLSQTQDGSLLEDICHYFEAV